MNKSLRGDYGNAPNTQPSKPPKRPISKQPTPKPIPAIKQSNRTKSS